MLTQISLEFITKGSITNKSAMIQVITWRRAGYKPLPETPIIWLVNMRNW